MKTAGQIAYETDCERKPLYHDGTARQPWDRLPDYAQWSWNRNPTPRDYSRHSPPARTFRS
jgi:hypothetical protein